MSNSVSVATEMRASPVGGVGLNAELSGRGAECRKLRQQQFARSPLAGLDARDDVGHRPPVNGQDDVALLW
jgi:hypothetical protein